MLMIMLSGTNGDCRINGEPGTFQLDLEGGKFVFLSESGESMTYTVSMVEPEPNGAYTIYGVRDDERGARPVRHVAFVPIQSRRRNRNRR